MRPFCNAGWRYLKTFESIIPVSGAKGRHVFVPTLATAPSTQFDEDEEAELGSTARGTSSVNGGSSTMVGHGADMNVDRHDDFTTPFSNESTPHSMMQIHLPLDLLVCPTLHPLFLCNLRGRRRLWHQAHNPRQSDHLSLEPGPLPNYPPKPALPSLFMTCKVHSIASPTSLKSQLKIPHQQN